ncbi:hypothetical protein G9C85_06250 [Halorubellus sp. JP-L1]|uniref:PD-(D/E)XK nuclease domain-containing protein n=1 Tax=Halorubellus sp. JP-L1 TaxID=2715753 RepID=UPI00140C84AC|nr:hypothetical protein [Halorubellus sp. JP-L1]NHN41238.1 hypothetical protein [Halorubellus sp. JP-L1]
MQNVFNSYKKTSVSDDNLGISVAIGLYEEDEGIEFSLSRTEVRQVGGSKKGENSKEIRLPNLSLSEVLEIVGLLEDWIDSESYPIMDRELRGIEGTYTYEIQGIRGETTEKTEGIDTLAVSVGEQSVRFRHWNESDSEWRGISIPSAERFDKGTPQGIQNVEALYQTFYDFFTKEYSEPVARFQNEEPVDAEKSAIYQIEEIFSRFGEMVVPLKDRRGERPPLTMDDEYDVQYFLHSLLLLHFEDVRREPHTEEHSAVSPRIDFLIKKETIGIEVKRASESRTRKDFRGELSEDKEQYRLDTDIDTLLVFVYDPEKQIENKTHFEESFEQDTPQMTTRVTVTR